MKTVKIRNFPKLSFVAAEAVNTLCTNLTFSGEHVRKIMVTSSHASEGKSFVSMNIMRTMANFGKTVALVDADLRRSMIGGHYGLRFSDEKPKGLAHMLAGMAGIEDIIYNTDIEGAIMIPEGRDVSNPMPLLNSPRLGELLDYLAEVVDYVIVDAPPVGTVIDAAQIAKQCDGTLLVIGYNATRRQELVDVKEQLVQTGCPILGVVLNQVKYDNYMGRKYYYKSYYNKYGYYSNDASEKEKGERSERRRSSRGE